MTQPLSPELFAPGPARDGRFEVKERWEECVNLPEGDPRRLSEFLHRQMNEEVNGLEMAAAHLAQFPDVEWDLRLSLARQCYDEARHVQMFRRLLERKGGRVGEYPVLNFQFRIVTRIPTLLGKLAVQNRSFEAGGIDGIAHGSEAARQQGDEGLAELFDAQLADEIGHVRFANEYIERRVREDPRAVLEMARALTDAGIAFREVMGAKAVASVQYGVDEDARREAGFQPEEIAAAARAARGRIVGEGA